MLAAPIIAYLDSLIYYEERSLLHEPNSRTSSEERKITASS